MRLLVNWKYIFVCSTVGRRDTGFVNCVHRKLETVPKFFTYMTVIVAESV